MGANIDESMLVLIACLKKFLQCTQHMEELSRGVNILDIRTTTVQYLKRLHSYARERTRSCLCECSNIDHCKYESCTDYQKDRRALEETMRHCKAYANGSLISSPSRKSASRSTLVFSPEIESGTCCKRGSGSNASLNEQDFEQTRALENESRANQHDRRARNKQRQSCPAAARISPLQTNTTEGDLVPCGLEVTSQLPKLSSNLVGSSRKSNESESEFRRDYQTYQYHKTSSEVFWPEFSSSTRAKTFLDTGAGANFVSETFIRGRGININSNSGSLVEVKSGGQGYCRAIGSFRTQINIDQCSISIDTLLFVLKEDDMPMAGIDIVLGSQTCFANDLLRAHPGLITAHRCQKCL